MSTATAQMVAVNMPKLTDGMDAGTIVSWLKATGDAIQPGDEIVEIETDKATMPFEAEAGGVLHIVADAGASVAVGALMAHILPPGTSPPEANGAGAGRALPSGSTPEPAVAPVRPAAPPAAADRRNGATDRVNASPVARRIAEKEGISLASVSGTGPKGRVVKRDVLAARAQPRVEPVAAPAAGASSAKGVVTRVELSRVQQVVARRMTEAKSAAPDFVLDAVVDMTDAVAWRERLKTRVAGLEGLATPSLNDLVIKAAAVALRDVPRANGAFVEGTFELYEHVNIGVAVAAEDSLLVPAVTRADERSLGSIAAEVRRLVAGAREGRLSPAELSGGTFTVSNLGMFGIDRFTAVLNPPQAAILAVGAIRAQPAVVDGELAVRRLMTLSLTCDHRILYGAEGARLLDRIRTLLERPEVLAL